MLKVKLFLRTHEAYMNTMVLLLVLVAVEVDLLEPLVELHSADWVPAIQANHFNVKTACKDFIYVYFLSLKYKNLPDMVFVQH